MHSECPECSKAIYSNAKSCRCGWRLSAPSKNAVKPADTWQEKYDALLADKRHWERMMDYVISVGAHSSIASVQKDIDKTDAKINAHLLAKEFESLPPPTKPMAHMRTLQ